MMPSAERMSCQQLESACQQKPKERAAGYHVDRTLVRCFVRISVLVHILPSEREREREKERERKRE